MVYLSDVLVIDPEYFFCALEFVLVVGRDLDGISLDEDDLFATVVSLQKSGSNFGAFRVERDGHAGVVPVVLLKLLDGLADVDDRLPVILVTAVGKVQAGDVHADLCGNIKI
jgi:hypothetical protein